MLLRYKILIILGSVSFLVGISVLIYFLTKSSGGSAASGGDGAPNPPPFCSREHPCPEGQLCNNGKECVTDNGQWLGWATTTQFGSGDGTWPSGGNPSLNLCKQILNHPNTMGGAIPWPLIAKEYPNRTTLINSIIDSATGKTADKSCYLVQPISKYPDEITGLSDGTDMCQGKNCIDINDNSIVAKMKLKDGTVKDYSPYLIVPYEGCGGDCNKSIPDCFNGCQKIQDFVSNFNVNLTDPTCEAINILSNPDTNKHKTWLFDDKTKQQMTDAKFDPVSISADSKFGREVNNLIPKSYNSHVNWCSEQNMHFDIAQDTPLWISDLPDGATSDIAQTNAISNIILRYKKVPCNILGNFDPSDTPVCFSGGWEGATDANCNPDAQYDGNLSKVCNPPSDTPRCCCEYGKKFNKTKNSCL